MKTKISKIIKKLDLKPHIEGGYYKRSYQSNLEIHLNDQVRLINTAIYYLLESNDFSCWHRLKSDEMWHHYCGSSLTIYQINDKGALSSTELGNLLENSNAEPQYLIPANTWFAAEVKSPESFALVGCSVTPGFEFDDFEMADRKILLSQYPEHEQIIKKLTRK